MSFWKDTKVLITGGAGLIGSALAINLVDEGVQITIIDDLSRGKKEHLEPITGNFELICCDLRDQKECLSHIKGFDIVIHMASRVGGISVYTDNPYTIMNDNIMMDTNVLNAVIKNKITKFFYASSAHVYPIGLQNSHVGVTIREKDAFPADPLLTYGWAKLISEVQIENAAFEHENFRAAIARYIGIYGANQDIGLDTGSVIPVFAHRAFRYPEIDFTIWGDGEETRSYCYIDDAVACTKLMIERLERYQVVGPYNVGSDESIKIKDIAQKMVTLSGKDIQLEFDPSKKAKIISQQCDCSEAHKELGWKATTSFDEGLKIMYNDVQRRLK